MMQDERRSVVRGPKSLTAMRTGIGAVQSLNLGDAAQNMIVAAHRAHRAVPHSHDDLACPDWQPCETPVPYTPCEPPAADEDESIYSLATREPGVFGRSFFQHVGHLRSQYAACACVGLPQMVQVPFLIIESPQSVGAVPCL